MVSARIIAALFVLGGGAAASASPDPQKGRFQQRDPKCSGLVVLNDQTWVHGRAPIVGQPPLNTQATYADGMNLYGFTGASPVTRRDPLGLSWDPFEEAYEIGLENLWHGIIGVSQARQMSREGMRAARAYENAAFLWDSMVWDRDVGILFSVIAGPFFSQICFVEGTIVATPDGPQSIECLALGQLVTSRVDPFHIVDKPHAGEIADDAVAVVSLRYRHQNGSTTEMELLRPVSLLKKLGIDQGMCLPVVVRELGISGEAEVMSIVPFVADICADNPTLTGRFVTDSAEVVDVWLAESSTPIGATPHHLLFSADRASWVSCGALQAGERVQCSWGTATVRSVLKRAQPARVFNIEVSWFHTYFVGEAEVWAHNPCNGSFPVSKPGWRVSRFEQKEWITATVQSMKAAGGAPPRIIRESVLGVLREARLAKDLYEDLVRHLGSLIDP